LLKVDVLAYLDDRHGAWRAAGMMWALEKDEGVDLIETQFADALATLQSIVRMLLVQDGSNVDEQKNTPSAFENMVLGASLVEYF